MQTDDDTVYSDRYVAFIDILGFSAIVRQLDGASKRAKELVGILENISTLTDQFAGDFEKDGLRTQSFSDCIVMSENGSPKGLFSLLASATTLTFALLSKGVLTRGGIAKGKLHHSDKIVFGPAMLEAYRLESTIARYPRILVDKATHLDYQRPSFAAVCERYERSPKLSFDSDGPPFLDTLLLCRTAPNEFADEIADCRAALQQALNDSVYDPAHFEKLRWFTIYWNGIAMRVGGSPVEFPHLKEFGPV
jgi:hypothetical protein